MASFASRRFVCSDVVRSIRCDKHPVRLLHQQNYGCRRFATTADTRQGLPEERRPFRLGIVGSGPAGFYAAVRVIERMQDVAVDMYETLPAPFGLVRYGVAPDHPEVKNCQERFEQVAQSPKFNYIGNIAVGHDVPLRSMVPHYDALLLAYGTSKDKRLGVPGEELQGVHSARAFVGWYNGLPEFEHLSPDLESDETAYVIGNGNVALDVARILLTPIEVLRKTDISDHAIEALSRSRIKHVSVIGRRGPMQAAFTIKEVRELMNLPEVGFQPIEESLLPSTEFVKNLPRLQQRRFRVADVLRKGTTVKHDQAKKSWSLNSMLTPDAFKSRANDITALGYAIFSRNRYVEEAARFDSSASVKATEDSVTFESRLIFRSIGYQSFAIQGLSEDLGVPFDERRNIVPNDGEGRVLSAQRGPTSLTAGQVPGCYCTGWVKTGPTGVIASSMEDAFASADVLMRDWADEVPFLNKSRNGARRGTGLGWTGVLQEADVQRRQLPRVVNWDDWRKLDAIELQRGFEKGKTRDKFLSRESMIDALP